MIVKVNKTAVFKKSKHVYCHDDIVLRTIRQMRKQGMRLVFYDESVNPTTMKFLKRATKDKKKNAA